VHWRLNPHWCLLVQVQQKTPELLAALMGVQGLRVVVGVLLLHPHLRCRLAVVLQQTPGRQEAQTMMVVEAVHLQGLSPQWMKGPPEQKEQQQQGH
jgi:hypothetical protein